MARGKRVCHARKCEMTEAMTWWREKFVGFANLHGTREVFKEFVKGKNKCGLVWCGE